MVAVEIFNLLTISGIICALFSVFAIIREFNLNFNLKFSLITCLIVGITTGIMISSITYTEMLSNILPINNNQFVLGLIIPISIIYIGYIVIMFILLIPTRWLFDEYVNEIKQQTKHK